MREKIEFSCANYFMSIVLLIVFALATALRKFHFHSPRNKNINLVPVIMYHFDFRLQFDINKNAFSKVLQKSCSKSQKQTLTREKQLKLKYVKGCFALSRLPVSDFLLFNVFF